jgi:hypothetical protein
MEERAKLGLKPEEALKDKKVCSDLKSKNWGVIEDGISSLSKAIDLRPDYDDAMAYLNLMYREKADLECDNSAQRAADLKTADEWVDKTMATKRPKQKSSPARRVSPWTSRNRLKAITSKGLLSEKAFFLFTAALGMRSIGYTIEAYHVSKDSHCQPG